MHLHILTVLATCSKKGADYSSVPQKGCKHKRSLSWACLGINISTLRTNGSMLVNKKEIPHDNLIFSLKQVDIVHNFNPFQIQKLIVAALKCTQFRINPRQWTTGMNTEQCSTKRHLNNSSNLLWWEETPSPFAQIKQHESMLCPHFFLCDECLHLSIPTSCQVICDNA